MNEISPREPWTMSAGCGRAEKTVTSMRNRDENDSIWRTKGWFGGGVEDDRGDFDHGYLCKLTVSGR